MSKIKIQNNHLPDSAGVYFMKDTRGRIIYIGKATSLKRRVSSYFQKSHDARIAELVSNIARIDYIETPTVIEALVLEANRIKKHKPRYNILERDDKSFSYLVITNEDFPKPMIMRGLELERLGIDPFQSKLSVHTRRKFLAVFGPYISGRALKIALDLIRKIVPWSKCESVRKRACFYYQLGLCPGVCVGAISKSDYRKNIRQLIMFFEGKKSRLMSQYKIQMQKAAAEQRFEDAADLKRKHFALAHIQDIALITREESNIGIEKDESYTDLNGRIEAYDISNISGESAVGSMVVFDEGKPNKSEYRKFKIKFVRGANDVAMLEEVLRRRFQNKSWETPSIIVIDGGEGQVGRARQVMRAARLNIPIIGIAKGFDRKQDRLVYDRNDIETARVAERGKEVFLRARDEAHRFAIRFHRARRAKKFLGR